MELTKFAFSFHLACKVTKQIMYECLQRYVELRYDLGDGSAILRSGSRLEAGLTHHIAAKRYNRDGLLRVDGQHDIKGMSPGSMKSLNLAHHGFMGYVPLNSTK